MKIAHSFWMKPCINDRLGIPNLIQLKINLYCFALSVAYVKKHGATITFYGDADSIKKFRVIPYDNFIQLDIPETANVNFWAQGKFYALQKMELGEIHIDGDVFLKGDKLYDILSEDYDCIVQGLEDENQVAWTGYDQARKDLSSIKFPDGCNAEIGLAYNVGTVGFKNQDLKDLYLKHYFESIKLADKVTPSDGSIFDLVIEQQHLYQLIKNNGYKVRTVLGKTELTDGKNPTLYDDAIELGYQHVLSYYKYKEFDKIRGELMKVDPVRCKILDLVTNNIKL